MSWQTLLAIGSGGFLGAIFRAYMIGIVNKNIPHDIPFGTLSVNLLGSFLLGLAFALFGMFENLSPQVKSFITTGFLGAFTTYSTFALESFFLISEKSLLLGASNALLNLLGTILAAGFGYKLIEILR